LKKFEHIKISFSPFLRKNLVKKQLFLRKLIGAKGNEVYGGRKL
jgi:hypothetical protein